MLSSCGGNPVATSPVPQQQNSLILSSTPTPTPSLISQPVKGYIYGYNTVTEEGENISNINVLDISAYNQDSSGNVPLVKQFSSYLQEEYPEDWNTPEIQKLYNRLDSALAQYKPLGEYDASAKVFSIYQDSQSDTPLSVNSEGQFEGNVLTNEQDSTVKLEVSLGEDDYRETETIVSSSDTLSLSAASGAVLKSCPEKIIALPNDIVIFKVFSDPAIDLKKAGLKFSLNNNSIGCIAPPVYLCVLEKHKYNEAYVFIYIKKNPDTPVDCVISAATGTGLSLNIPLSVVKRCAAISGRVYTGEKPLIKGYVKSIGPKSHCKLDGEGNYSLPAVFLGHERSVIATWWTMDGNGKKVKHREERIIDFFSQDVSGFVFGVPPAPTPTLTPSATPTPRPPYDEFYNEKISEVLSQYDQWKTELGVIEANQHTIQWLNGELPDGPPIPDEVAGATSIGNPYDIWVEFKDGMSECISTSDPIIIEEQGTDELLSEKEEIKPITYLTATSSNNTTVKNADVIMLSPYFWQKSDKYQVEKDIRKKLEQNKYYVKCINTNVIITDSSYSPPPSQMEGKDIEIVWNNPYSPFPDKYVKCYVLNWDNIVTPMTLETMGKYGIIYLNAHGGPVNINEQTFDPDNVPSGAVFRMSCTIIASTPDPNPNFRTPLDNWLIENSFKRYRDFFGYHNKGWWYYRDRELINESGDKKWVKELALTNYYFDYLNSKAETNFEGSLIYWGDCYTWHMRNSFNTARVYIGNNKSAYSSWAYPFAYDFFYFMMYGTKNCPNIDKDSGGKLLIPGAPIPAGTPTFDVDEPLDATGALNALTDYYKVNPDPTRYPVDTEDGYCNYCTAKIWQKDPDEHVYFPVPVIVTVHKK
jgi:hypothetical protein